MAIRPDNIEDRFIRNADADVGRKEMERLGKDVEPTLAEFLKWVGREAGVFKDVERANETEDHEGNDIFITMQNDLQFAVQVSLSRNEETRVQKFREIALRPTVGKRYDRQGRPVPCEPMPRVLIGGDPARWKQAIARHARGLPPESYFPDAQRLGDELLKQFRDNFAYFTDYFKKMGRSGDAELYASRLQFLTEILSKEGPRQGSATA